MPVEYEFGRRRNHIESAVDHASIASSISTVDNVPQFLHMSCTSIPTLAFKVFQLPLGTTP